MGQAILALRIGGFVAEHEDLAQVEVDILRLAVLGDPRVLRQIELVHLAEVGTQTGKQGLAPLAVGHGLRHHEVHIYGGGCRRGAGGEQQAQSNQVSFHRLHPCVL
ncbi:hypothetical protein D3C76_1678530 [compost metagenome]